MPSKNAKDLEQDLLENLGALCGRVGYIAIEAGKITEKYLEEVIDLQVDMKNDDSPVTLADREAETFIQMSLERLTPSIPMVGEEAVALDKVNLDLSKHEYFWLVDPLDGTKEYISGGDEFTTNIALIRNNEPILGVIYVPAQGILYSGHGPGTAKRWDTLKEKEKSISVREIPKEGMTVVASRSHGNDEALEKFLEKFKVNKVLKKGSSLKICAVAEGKADIYPRLGPTCEWDIAAGDAILRSAGGIITDINGDPIKYGGFNPRYLNPEFVACSFDWFDADKQGEKKA